MENYVFESGVYGNKEYVKIYSEIQVKKRIFGIFLTVLFPDLHNMSIIYPELRQKRYMLAWFWIKRLFEKLILGKRHNDIKIVIKANDRAIATSNHLKSLVL